MTNEQANWRSLAAGLALLDDSEALSSIGVRALDEAKAHEGGAALAERYAGSMPMGTLWPNETWPRSQKLAQGKLLVAEGPAVPPPTQEPTAAQSSENLGQGVWYLDPKQPDRLWFGFIEDAAPILFIPVNPTLADMKAAIEALRPADEPPMREVRAWMGWMNELTVPNVYSGQLVQADPAQLTNYWLFNPYRGGETMSVYSICTQSRASYELHYDSAYVWNVAYRPAPHSEAVRCVNEALGADLYPLDMPADLLGCMLGFYWMTKEALEQNLADEKWRDSWPSLIFAWAGVCYCEPDFESRLGRFAREKSKKVRQAAAQVCHIYGFVNLMKTMLSAERDSQVRKSLQQGVHPKAPLVNKRPLR